MDRTKHCYKCKTYKAIKAFSKNISRCDGLQNKCKECVAFHKKEYNQTNIAKELNRKHVNKYVNSVKGKLAKKAYLSSPEGKDMIREAKNRTNSKYPNAAKCRARTKYLVKTGVLIRPNNCITCHIECKPDAHHVDYNSPDVIQWLCQSCHEIWHKIYIPMNRSTKSSGAQ